MNLKIYQDENIGTYSPEDTGEEAKGNSKPDIVIDLKYTFGHHSLNHYINLPDSRGKS